MCWDYTDGAEQRNMHVLVLYLLHDCNIHPTIDQCISALE